MKILKNIVRFFIINPLLKVLDEVSMTICDRLLKATAPVRTVYKIRQLTVFLLLLCTYLQGILMMRLSVFL